MQALAQVQPLPSESRRCVLLGDCTGDSRLAVAVAAELIARGADVVLVAGGDRDGHRLRSAVERNKAVEETPAEVVRRRLTVTPLSGDRDLQKLLEEEPARLPGARSLLALSEDREQNLRAALVGHRVAEHVPVVVRAFDPDLAEEFESADERMGVRGAYSVAHLSSPAFVASALLQDHKRHLLTMRAGTDYVSVYRLRVTSADARDPLTLPRCSKSRGLLGRSPQEIARDDGCEVLAWRRGDGGWRDGSSVPDGTTLDVGDEVVVGGPLSAVLELARGRPRRRMGRRRRRGRSVADETVATARGRRGRWGGSPLGARPASPALRIRNLIADLERWSRAGMTISQTLSARLLLVMGVLVTIASIAATPEHRPSDVLYQWASTALGNPTDASLGGVPEKILAALGLLAGGVALGLATSLMSTALIQRRMVEGMRRRARRLRHHVVIVGLGELGVRVAELLRDIGVACAVVEPSAGGGASQLAANQAFERVAEHSPVLTGELGDALERARIDRADALIACSKDNLVNIEACMRAKRRNDRASFRTVARVFDDVDAMQAAEALGVDDKITAVNVAAPAFADAALEHLPVRSINVAPEDVPDARAGGRQGHASVQLAAVKWPGDRALAGDTVGDWHAAGIRILGRRRRNERRPGPDWLKPSDVAVLAGPARAIARVTGDRRRRSGSRRDEDPADASNRASIA